MLTVHIRALVVTPRAAIVVAFMSLGPAEPTMMFQVSPTVLAALYGIAGQVKDYCMATRAARN